MAPKKFLTNEKGEEVSVVLDIKDYREMLKDLEELESIRAYDAAKTSGDSSVLFHQATDEIERSQK
ncbi:MAG: hypothetical protein WBC04_18000 [Candidatus Acidiferrales bacterium]